MTVNKFEKLVEAELERFRLHDCPTNCYGLVAAAEDDLPYGWVRIYGDNATEDFVDAIEFVNEMRDYDPENEFEENQKIYGQAVKATSSAGVKPTSSQDWPTELFQTEALEEGSPNENPNHLITLSTNAGLQFAAGPHGVSECALANGLQYGLSGTREEATASLELAEAE